MSESSAYQGREAGSYDRDRAIEPLWHVENAFVGDLLRRNRIESLLDMPVGTGRFFDLYPRCEVVGVDLSEHMLAQAATRAGESAAVSIRLLRASATALPLGDAQFDLVLCWRFLHLLPAEVLPTVFAEMKRVCRGTICVQCYLRSPWHERVAAKARRWARRLRLLFRRERRLSPWSHIRAYDHSLALVLSAAKAAGLAAPDGVSDLGGYEGTRVCALVWTLR